MTTWHRWNGEVIDIAYVRTPQGNPVIVVAHLFAPTGDEISGQYLYAEEGWKGRYVPGPFPVAAVPA